MSQFPSESMNGFEPDSNVEGSNHYNHPAVEDSVMNSINKAIKNYAPTSLVKSKYMWPIFVEWLRKIAANFRGKVNLAEILNVTNVEITVPYDISSILRNAIVAYFHKDIYAPYDDESDGFKLFAKMNLQLMTINNLERTQLINQLIKSVNEPDDLKFIESTRIISYFIPHMAKSMNLFLCLRFKNTPRFFRDYGFFNLTAAETEEFDSCSPAIIMTKYREFTAESALEDSPAAFFTHAGNNANKNKNPVKTNKFNKKGKKGKSKGNKNSRSSCKYCGKDNHPSEKCFKKPESAFFTDYYDEVYHVDTKYPVISDNTVFILDSGATTHVVQDKNMLFNLEKYGGTIKTLAGPQIAEYRGCCRINPNLLLKNALTCYDAPYNIISTTRLNDEGYDVNMGHTGETLIYLNGELIATSEKKNNLVFLNTADIKSHMVFNIDETNYEKASAIHQASGHAKTKQLSQILIKQGMYVPTAALKSIVSNCSICQGGYMQLSHGRTMISKNDMKIGQLLVTDVFGPINHKYGLIVSDMVSKYTIGITLNSRKAVTDATITVLKKFANLLHLSDNKICFLRSDNEYRTKLLADYCNDQGIIQEFTAPHSSYQNGAAENLNMQLKRKMQFLLNESNIPKHLWPYAFQHALFLLNHLPIGSSNLVPWTVLTKQVKDMHNLATFGTLAFAYNYTTDQKVFTRHTHGVFLGYDGTTKVAYIYIKATGKVMRTSSFHTIPNRFPFHNRALFDAPQNDVLDFDASQADSPGYSLGSSSFPGSSRVTRQSDPSSSPTPSSGSSGATPSDSSPADSHASPDTEDSSPSENMDVDALSSPSSPGSSSPHQDRESPSDALISTKATVDLVPEQSNPSTTPTVEEVITAPSTPVSSHAVPLLQHHQPTRIENPVVAPSPPQLPSSYLSTICARPRPSSPTVQIDQLTSAKTSLSLQTPLHVTPSILASSDTVAPSPGSSPPTPPFDPSLDPSYRSLVLLRPTNKRSKLSHPRHVVV